MYNIKQITNFDIKDAATVIKQVVAGGDVGYDVHGYKIVEYKTVSQTYLKNNIPKLGYCCEPKAIQYPIFLTINGQEEEFQIGKTGMFEMQPETWINVNAHEPEINESNVLVTEIKVPWRWLEDPTDPEPEPADYQGYNFKLDFIYNIN